MTGSSYSSHASPNKTLLPLFCFGILTSVDPSSPDPSPRPPRSHLSTRPLRTHSDGTGGARSLGPPTRRGSDVPSVWVVPGNRGRPVGDKNKKERVGSRTVKTHTTEGYSSTPEGYRYYGLWCSGTDLVPIRGSVGRVEP